jgi:hypothetical protein
MWSAWRILWALTCQIHVVVGKHQAAINSSMNNCGTKHRVMLPTSKLNSSDSQVSRTSIFLLPLQEKVTPTLFKNVMLCYNLSFFMKLQMKCGSIVGSIQISLILFSLS